MVKESVLQTILSELRELRKEVKEVRETDIPNLRTALAVEQTRWPTTMKTLTVLGALISVVISVAAFIRHS